jgi:hypothetical protein
LVRFGFYQKKVNKPNLKKKKTETGSNRPGLIRFGFLGQKPIQTGLAWFFSGLVQFGFLVLGL